MKKIELNYRLESDGILDVLYQAVFTDDYKSPMFISKQKLLDFINGREDVKEINTLIYKSLYGEYFIAEIKDITEEINALNQDD